MTRDRKEVEVCAGWWERPRGSKRQRDPKADSRGASLN